MSEDTSNSHGRRRIVALDLIRGFALCGILLANVQPIAGFGSGVVREEAASGPDWMGTLVYHRFFPIFGLLFGIGFSLLLDAATARVARPRLVLARRLLVLLGVGLLHYFLLWNGDVLTVYAVVGLVILLPSSWLPRWVVAVLAGLLLIGAVLLGGGSYALTPGLFLLGSALTRFRVVERIEHSIRVPLALGVFLVAAAAPFLWQPDLKEAPFAFAAAGVLTAGAYVCGLIVLLRTPLRPLLRMIFEPLGRMALTNYLSATVLVLLISRVVGGRPDAWPTTTVIMIAGGILIAQWIFSSLWLRVFRQGPLEWLWRWSTWLRRPLLRRVEPVTAATSGSSIT